MQLTGKRALVLGASRPVGRAIAGALADRGVRLALPWFDWPDSVKTLHEQFGANEHLLLEADLRRPEAVAGLMRAIERRFGGLDILVNNVERGGMPVLHGSYRRPYNQNQWQLELETTLRAKWLVFDQALPLLRRAEGAAVVNISSIAGLVGRSGPADLLFSDGYAAANRAISSLTETWARIGAPTIRVNELMLGLIDHRHGPGTRGWNLLDPDQRERLIDHTLLARTGTPDEVARAVLFLIGEADFITGTVLRMDGGYLLGGESAAIMPTGIREEKLGAPEAGIEE
ncbi:MAG: SDR family NAD(P)-dependent oxidoreductase [Desulfobulbus sp.]|jgi:3-oxoacyl-[acyl-carrier protein] reductase